MPAPHHATGVRSAAIGLFTFLAVVGISTTDTRSQQFPARPITLITGTSPGSADDIVARIVAERLKDKLGQPVVVQSMAGALGAIAIDHVAKSAPDGYRILLAGSDQFRNEHAQHLEPITLATKTPILLLVKADSGINSLQELIKQGASVRIGTGSFTGRLSLLTFQTVTGVKFQAEPFQRADQALTALAAGQITGTFCPLPCGNDLIGQGKIKALAISSSQPSGLLKDVRTFGEQGVDMVDQRWNAAFAPRGTPKEIMDTLNAAFVAALESRDVRDKLLEMGATPSPTQRGGFAQAVNANGGSPSCGKPCPNDCKNGCGSDDCCKASYPRPE